MFYTQYIVKLKKGLNTLQKRMRFYFIFSPLLQKDVWAHDCHRYSKRLTSLGGGGDKILSLKKLCSGVYLKGTFIAIVFFISVTALAAPRVLDIIIGGGMGEGLSCKEDTDCASAEFCHDEEFRCVECSVPPLEWTGTECVCPAGTIEKDGKDCVECLTDTDCAGVDNHCNTDFNQCQRCQFPKVWQDNMCLCPEGMIESGGGCICEQTHAEFNQETGTCECALSEDKCAGVHFDEKDCLCCPLDKPYYKDGQCHSCEEVNPDMPLWNPDEKKCVCDSSKGLYGDMETGCARVACIPNTEPFSAKGAITFCTEHDRYLRIDNMENQIRVAFLDGWNGLHNYDYRLWGCRCSQYNTFNDAPDGGHYTNATIHKLPYSKYSLKYPIYFNISGVGCDSGVYGLKQPGSWQHVGVCAGTGSTEANITYTIQTEVEGMKCPIRGGICDENDMCKDGLFDEADNICGLPGAQENCRCPFDKKKIDGRCDWTCQQGQIIQDNGICACPAGTKMVDGWCRNPDCNESAGYIYDSQTGQCVCNEDAGYYTDANGKCTYCYGATSVWNHETHSCETKCMDQTYTVASPHYSSQYPTGRWNEETQMCECNENIFFFGKYPNCKRCQSTGTMYNEETGMCICDLEQGIAKPDGSCELCMPSAGPSADGSRCVCRDSQKIMYPTGECLACSNLTEGFRLRYSNDCGTCKGWFYHNNGGCYQCNNTQYQHHQNVEKDECHLCNNRYWRASDKGCIMCDQNADQGNVTQQECYRCPNRYWVETNAAAGLGTCSICPNGGKRDSSTGLCICPNGQVYSRSARACVSCTVAAAFLSTQTASEESCANLRYVGTNNYSYLCSKANEYTYTTRQSCENCSEGVRWFRNSDKLCLSCEFPSATGGSKAECSECARRWFSGTNPNAGTCSLCISPTKANSNHTGCEGCPSGKFWHESNQCIACLNTSGVYTTPEQCHRCSTQFATFRTDGKTACYGCEDGSYSQGGVETTTYEECSRCPNRYLGKDKICRLCPRGYDCPRDMSGADAVICPAGYYCPGGQMRMIQCPLGTYRGGQGAYDKSHCTTCARGYYCPTSDKQLICPAGYYCPVGATQPTHCPSGTYRGGQGAYDKTHCVTCAKGYYCPTPDKQLSCPAGSTCLAGSTYPQLKPGNPDNIGSN